MKCKCGFEGWAEIGDFGFNTRGLFRNHFKCPKCGETEKIVYIENFDGVREALLFPINCKGGIDGMPTHAEARQVIVFITGGADNSLVGYSIHCPVCQWGHGSALSVEDYKKVKEWAEENKIDSAIFPVIKKVI